MSGMHASLKKANCTKYKRLSRGDIAIDSIAVYGWIYTVT